MKMTFKRSKEETKKELFKFFMKTSIPRAMNAGKREVENKKAM